MPRVTHENTQVFFLADVTNPAAPTSAEISGGNDITGQIPVDGVATSNTANNASQAMLGDAFVSEEPGTWGRGMTITFTRDDEDDEVFDLFDYKTSGFLVISRFGEPATGSVVEVYKVTTHKPAPLATAENEMQKFEVMFAIREEPTLDAVVDGS